MSSSWKVQCWKAQGQPLYCLLSWPNCFLSQTAVLKVWSVGAPQILSEDRGHKNYNLRSYLSFSLCGYLHWWYLRNGEQAVGVLAWSRWWHHPMLVVTFFTFTYSQGGEKRPVLLGNSFDESVKVSVLLNLNTQVPFYLIFWAMKWEAYVRCSDTFWSVRVSQAKALWWAELTAFPREQPVFM